MSIIGVGTDIVKKARIEKIWLEFGYSFEKRILTKFEQQQLQSQANKPSYIAKRFAAKEAVAKALGTGFGGSVILTEIEIYNNNLGKPEIRLLGKTKAFANSIKVNKIHLSLTDEKEYAIAFVVLEASLITD